MKNWFWIPLAALVGVIAGSWGPREDLARFKEGVQAEKASRKASGSSGFDAFARLANIPDVASGSSRPATNIVAKGRKRSVSEPLTNEVTQAATPKPVSSVGRSKEDLGLRLEQAADLWNTRVELAKSQWKAKLGIPGESSRAAFDAAFDDMNGAIRSTMQALAEEVEKSGRLNPELSLRLLGDVSRTLAETYDALGETVPAERRGEISDVPVFEFIDPMVAEPLVSVQDKLGGGFEK